ncbi:MAG: hypothetical protein H3C47_07045 [Candidatus Cloacimonetes bacterium]|nr:hypothetical protein [Candidatus Cloacimonadota bacterium]
MIYRVATSLTMVVFMVQGSLLALDPDLLREAMENQANMIREAGARAAIADQLYDGSSILNNTRGQSETRSGLLKIVSTIETAEDLNSAMQIADQFAMGSTAEQYVASLVREQLKRRALFLGLVGQGVDRNSVRQVVDSLKPVELSEFLRPEDFMTVAVESLQAVVYANSRKWDDRKTHLEQIFSRHECDVLSSFHWDEKEEAHNYLVQCKDYVIKPLVEHYGGEVSPELEVEVELKTGGWFTGKDLTVSIVGTSGGQEKQSLAYLQAMIENNPFQYIQDNNLASLVEIGKIKEIAGERTLVLKNARAKFWFKAAGAKKSQAIYFSEKKYGDLILKGGN